MAPDGEGWRTPARGNENEGAIELIVRNLFASGPDFAEMGGRNESPFAGLNVLICEDEYLLADDLARRFELSGARVVGPTATLQGSLETATLAEALGAAVLDIRLGEDLIFPVADILAARGVPFVFFSGYDDVALPSRFGGVRRLSKMEELDRIIVAVLTERVISCANAGRPPARREDDKIAAILPRLRLLARLLTDETKSDDLVAKALERAIADVTRRSAYSSTVRWLMSLLEEVWLRQQRQRYLH